MYHILILHYLNNIFDTFYNFLVIFVYEKSRASLITQLIKNPSAVQGTLVKLDLKFQFQANLKFMFFPPSNAHLSHAPSLTVIDVVEMEVKTWLCDANLFSFMSSLESLLVESACNVRDPGNLGQENLLEIKKATHSSIDAGEFHGQKSLVDYNSWGHKETRLSD